MPRPLRAAGARAPQPPRAAREVRAGRRARREAAAGAGTPGDTSEAITALAFNNDNELFVGGHFSATKLEGLGGLSLTKAADANNVVQPDAFLAKIGGNLVSSVWSGTAGGTVTDALHFNAVSDTPGSTAISVGDFNAPRSIRTKSTGAPKGGADFFMAAVLPNGNTDILLTYGGSKDDIATSVAATLGYEIVVGGTYESADLTIDGVTLPAPAANKTGAFVHLWSVAGGDLWTAAYASANADDDVRLTAVGVDPIKSRAFVYGDYRGTVDLGKGAVPSGQNGTRRSAWLAALKR